MTSYRPASPEHVLIDLSGYGKIDRDLIWMDLLGTHGFHSLTVSNDGLSMLVELTSSLRPIDVRQQVKDLIPRDFA